MTTRLEVLALVALASACTGSGLSVPSTHQPAAMTCSASQPTGACTINEPGGECMAATDCTMGDNAHCLAPEHNGTCYCAYDDCKSDADCPANTLCVCGGSIPYGPPTNTCLPSNCRTDADCGDGQYCSPTLDTTCGIYGGVVGYACTTKQDRCHTDADCPKSTSSGPPHCSYSQELGYWACSSGICAG
jgi:hypothetical protein